MKYINFAVGFLVIFSANVTAGDRDDQFSDRITCAIEGPGYVIRKENGEPDIECRTLVYATPDKIITGAITQDEGSLMYSNADNVSVNLDYRNSVGVQPDSYHSSKCSDIKVISGDFSLAELNSTEHRTSTCLANDNFGVARSGNSRHIVPSRLLVAKDKFRPIAEFFSQDSSHVYTDIQNTFGWASYRVSWEYSGQPYEIGGVPGGANRGFLRNLYPISTVPVSHRKTAKGSSVWTVEHDTVQIDTSKKMCLDLGTFKYAAAGVFHKDHRLSNHWYVPGELPYPIGTGVHPQNMPFAPTAYTFLTPNTSYVYSNQIENHHNSKNKSAAVFRKRHFYCVDGEEGVDIYSRDESTNTCSLDTGLNFGGESLTQASYSCTYRKDKRIYEGETGLVPVQVGDITTFIPYLHYENPVKSTSLVAKTYSATVPVVQKVAYMYCDDALAGTGAAVRGSCSHLVDTDKYCLDSRVGLGNGRVMLSKNADTNVGLHAYCRPGSPLIIKSNFVNVSGSALAYKFDSNILSKISYPYQDATAQEWADAIGYYTSRVTSMSNSLFRILSVFAPGTGGEVDRTRLLCEMSNALYVTAGYGYGTEFHERGDAAFPAECNTGHLDGYWIHTNTPSFASSGHPIGEERNNHSDFTEVPGVYEQIRSIIYVRANFSADETVGEITGDLIEELNVYLDEVVGDFVVKANLHSDRLNVEACGLVNEALTEMIRVLNENNSDGVVIPTAVVSCNQ